MANEIGRHNKKDSLALGLDNRFNRKPRWMSGMALHLLQSQTATSQQKQDKKVLTHGKRPRHI
ncbi:MAG: hypothetical protein P1P93_11755 [Gammaproteobacteria bacterium]|nr:hypothetical protein [Gammaproteobacteria bacterium]